MSDAEDLAELREHLATAEKAYAAGLARLRATSLANSVNRQDIDLVDPDLALHSCLLPMLRSAVAKLEERLPKAEPYRPWVVNLNPVGQRFGRVGCVTGAANGKADVGYDDGVGMGVDIKKHLVLVADLGFIEKERLRCGCGSGFPSLWCCWSREPAKRETGYAPRVTCHECGEERIVKVDENSITDGVFRCLILERADGTTYSAPASRLSLAPKALLIEPKCGCGSGKASVRCHPMSPPEGWTRAATAKTEPPEEPCERDA